MTVTATKNRVYITRKESWSHETMERRDTSASTLATIRIIVNGFLLMVIPIRVILSAIALSLIAIGLKVAMWNAGSYSKLSASSRRGLNVYIQVCCRVVLWSAMGVWWLQKYSLSNEELATIQRRVRESNHVPSSDESTDVNSQEEQQQEQKQNHDENELKQNIQRLLTDNAHLFADNTVPAATIVANHAGPFDPFVIGAMVGPVSAAAKDETVSYPFIGTIAQQLNCLFIGKHNRKQIVSEIMKKTLTFYRSRCYTMPNAVYHHDNMNEEQEQEQLTTDSIEYPPQLLIFPEGTTTAGHSMLKFFPGAFKSGAPVKPIVVQYAPYYFYNMGWTGNVNQAKYFLQHFSQFWQCVQVVELPVYIPNDAEIRDPDLYAENVRCAMSLAVKRCIGRELELSDAYFSRS